MLKYKGWLAEKVMRIQEWNEDYLGGNVLSLLTIEFFLFVL